MTHSVEERQDGCGPIPRGGNEDAVMKAEPHPKNGAPSHKILYKFRYLLGAHGVREALQTIFIVYLARKSTTTYGQFMLALSMGEILLFISEFGLNQHLVSLLVRKEGDAARALARVTAVKAGLLGLGGLGVAGFVFWQDYPPMLRAIALVLGVGVGLEALASSFFVSCQVQGRQDLEGKVRVVAAVFGFGYGIVMLLLGAAPLTVAFYKLVETSCNLAGMAFLAGQKMRPRFRSLRLREVWDTVRTSAVFTLMAVATILYNSANMFFLQRFAGENAVAQYSVAWRIVDGIACLISNLLLRNVLFPLFSGLWEKDRTDFRRIAQSSACWLLAAAFPVMFILWAESNRLIPLIFGPGYTDAIWMQKILTAAVLTGFVHNLAAYLMMSMKKERLLLAFYLIGLSLNFVCCGVLIPTAPLMGSVLSIIVTKLLVAAMTVSYCQRRLGIFPARPLMQLCLTLGAGGGLYCLAVGILPREVAEFLAIAPVLGIALHWRRKLLSEPARKAAMQSPDPSNF